MVFFFSRLKSPLPTHKSSSPSACLSSGGQETLKKPKNCTSSLLPFPLDSKKGKRVVRSETLLIGMGKRLTPPSLVWFQNCNASREGSAAPAAHWREEEAQGEIFVIPFVFWYLYGHWAVFRIVTFWYGSGSGSCSFRFRFQQKMIRLLFFAY